MRTNPSFVTDIIKVFGSQARIASDIGVRQSTVSSWVRVSRIPSKRIPQIIAAAARLDPPVHLRPDDFFDLPTCPAPVEHSTPFEASAV